MNNPICKYASRGYSVQRNAWNKEQFNCMSEPGANNVQRQDHKPRKSSFCKSATGGDSAQYWSGCWPTCLCCKFVTRE